MTRGTTVEKGRELGDGHPGREVTVPWRETKVRAWLPDPLADRAIEPSEKTVRATEAPPP